MKTYIIVPHGAERAGLQNVEGLSELTHATQSFLNLKSAGYDKRVVRSFGRAAEDFRDRTAERPLRFQLSFQVQVVGQDPASSLTLSLLTAAASSEIPDLSPIGHRVHSGASFKKGSNKSSRSAGRLNQYG